jgi:hypothetical protein
MLNFNNQYHNGKLETLECFTSFHSKLNTPNVCMTSQKEVIVPPQQFLQVCTILSFFRAKNNQNLTMAVFIFIVYRKEMTYKTQYLISK